VRLRAAVTLAAAGVLAAALAGCGGAPAPLPTPPPGAVVITAQGTAFATQQVTAPAGTSFTLFFENRDNEPHNVRLWDAANSIVYSGQIVNGPTAITETVPALAPGTYRFTCDIHPNMSGTLTVQ
jgi:plastocyanin